MLYIAMSLDGYIADQKGSVNWLSGQDDNIDNEDTYSEFIKDVDTVLMGWKTYNQIVTELSPDEWVYSGLDTYIFTHRSLEDKDDIHFTGEQPEQLVERLKSEEGKNIWICGGAEIVNQLLKVDLIDRFHIAVIPVLLGSGTRLFPESQDKKLLRLITTKQYNGICELLYEKRSERKKPVDANLSASFRFWRPRKRDTWLPVPIPIMKPSAWMIAMIANTMPTAPAALVPRRATKKVSAIL